MRGGDVNVEEIVDEVVEEVEPVSEMGGGGKKLKGRGAHKGGKDEYCITIDGHGPVFTMPKIFGGKKIKSRGAHEGGKRK